RAFWRASIPRRTATILAGGVFNLVFAGLVFSALAIPGQSSAISSWSPLTAAGVRDGDKVTAVDGRPINRSDIDSVTDDMHQATDATQGRPAVVVFQSADGARHTASVAPYLQIVNEDRSNGLPVVLAIDTINDEPVSAGDPAALFHDGAAVTITAHVPGETR